MFSTKPTSDELNVNHVTHANGKTVVKYGIIREKIFSKLEWPLSVFYFEIFVFFYAFEKLNF